MRATRAGNVNYLNDLQKSYELYSREVYKAMNDQTLRKHLDVLSRQLDSSVIFKADNIEDIVKVTEKIKKNKFVTEGDKKFLRQKVLQTLLMLQKMEVRLNF